MARNLIFVSLVAVFSFGFIAGCENEAQSSALIGSAIGAGIGALAGDGEGALIGAAIGGGVGYVAGNESDKKKTQTRNSEVDVWVINSNGSKTKVSLKKSGAGFVGPKNEYYDSMPTQGQLKVAYGF
jgi:hypothetical protein